MSVPFVDLRPQHDELRVALESCLHRIIDTSTFIGGEAVQSFEAHFAAYCGAVQGQDGWGAMNVSFGNLIRATAEINESIFPVRQLARDYETDSGGPGEFRGGCGSLYRKQVMVPATVSPMNQPAPS